MTTLLDRPRTTSGTTDHRPDVNVAATLLGSDFGTSAGHVQAHRLRPVGLATSVPVPQVKRATDDSIEVRALRDRIVSHGITKQEIARAIGVDRRTLSGYARGDIRPSPQRLQFLRILAALVEEVASENPRRVRDVLLSRRGRVSLIDQLQVHGRSILSMWRNWVSRGEAVISVTERQVPGEPVWAAAARAVQEGRLGRPPRAASVRPESTYETDPREAKSFVEPEYRSGRRSHP